jgi:phthalate 4,5-dioxygenase oxygenase subunit
MLSQMENDRLTHVGPGTPMGNVWRRYWLPVLLSEELPERDGAPVRVRLLGEDLVTFRDSDGNVGLVDAFCPHRRAPMFFGRNEECGLRCVYHGWKFDRSGTCVDMPSEPPDSLFKSKVTIAAYPTWEGGDIVWAYLGGPSAAPGHPNYEFIRTPATHRFISKTLEDCNYLQALEGGLDSSHATIMHNGNIGDRSWLRDYEATVPRIDVEPTAYGYQYTGLRSRAGDAWLRGYQYVMPSMQLRGMTGGPRGGSFAPRVDGHVWVPMDDATTAVFNIHYSLDPERPIPLDEALSMEIGAGRGPDDLLPDFHLKKNATNDYLIDRNVQRTRSFTGIAGINTQDFAVQEGMGTVVDRSREHLGTTDRAIIVMRQMLLEAVAVVEAGGEPRGVDPMAHGSVRAFEEIVPAGDDWRAVAALARIARY